MTVPDNSLSVTFVQWLVYPVDTPIRSDLPWQVEQISANISIFTIFV